ncbi:MAG: alpha-L-fucosidase [Muribaculaceae bacterium]|nr:alpha-L-fucosidase [Muribaculaceae bacterium]
MKKLVLALLALLGISHLKAAEIPADTVLYAAPQSVEEFRDAAFGIFIHWGIYSIFGQGEWYLNYGPQREEYAKAASAFYPANFNAAQWVKSFKDAGAKYITITTRHHDGFSMFHTEYSPYNIVDATPFGRDIIKELADECEKQGMRLHFYYSHVDWMRDDYPMGRTGHDNGKKPENADWPQYYRFMNNQLTELLTKYGKVGAIWFDGKWDHDEDTIPFNWQLEQQYNMIHRLQPDCLVANNHHEDVYPGEDIQIFERDLPGENTAGYSEQAISSLPLETCQTMNGMWGYKIVDKNYKSVPVLIKMLVEAAGRGGNLLLNVGPQPDGSIPADALERLSAIGDWLKVYGETVYSTRRGDFPPQAWGTSTRKGNKLYVHVFDTANPVIYLPLTAKIKKARTFPDANAVKFTKMSSGGYCLEIGKCPDVIDYVVELETE